MGVPSLGTSWRLGEVACGEGLTEDFQKEETLRGIPNLHGQITGGRRESKLLVSVCAKSRDWPDFHPQAVTGPRLGCLFLQEVSVWGTLGG